MYGALYKPLEKPSTKVGMIIDIIVACWMIINGLALLIGFPLFLLWLLW